MVSHQTYIIESILATGALYVIYLLTLRNRPMLVFNRFMLLGMVLLGTLLPFINFSLPQNSEIPTSSFLIEEVFVNFENQVEIEKTGFQLHYVYFIIAFVLLVYLLVQAIHLIRLRKRSKLLNDGSKTYNLIEGRYPHFSFFKQIFINKKLIGSDDELVSIIEHEKVHVQEWHSLDILFFEVFKIVFWFNPFIWLLKKLAIENHEYLADRGMMDKTSKNLVEYFNELLQNSLFTYKITLANNFNHSLLKKRVVMMTKRLRTVERLIPLFILPILIFVGIFFACTEGNQILGEQPEEIAKPEKAEPGEYPEELFFVVEEMPQFNGGDHNKFREYVGDSLVYPQEAKEKGIVGRVFVQFVVGSDGKVHDATVVRGVDPLLDAEALRVVNSSPDWTPGVQRGRKVAVQFTFPITFLLGENKIKEESDKQVINVVAPTTSSGENQRFANFSAYKDDNETPEIVGRFVVDGLENEADISYLKGEVEFAFDLNEDAQVSNFSIIKSPNSKLSEKAKLLLVINQETFKMLGAKGKNLRGVMSF